MVDIKLKLKHATNPCGPAVTFVCRETNLGSGYVIKLQHMQGFNSLSSFTPAWRCDG
jgi:hypothetical protein